MLKRKIMVAKKKTPGNKNGDSTLEYSDDEEYFCHEHNNPKIKNFQNDKSQMNDNNFHKILKYDKNQPEKQNKNIEFRASPLSKDNVYLINIFLK